jgi:hypothetical protein
MSNIEPVVFPIVGTATKLKVTVLGFPTDAVTTNTYYELLTDQNIICIQGNYQMTPEQFSAWGSDNSVVDGYIAQAIGVVIVLPIEDVVAPSLPDMFPSN